MPKFFELDARLAVLDEGRLFVFNPGKSWVEISPVELMEDGRRMSEAEAREIMAVDAAPPWPSRVARASAAPAEAARWPAIFG